MGDPNSRVRDKYPYNDSFNRMNLAIADRRFEHLIERRERFIERSRFGVLALNGASAIGILSSYHALRTDLSIDPRSALAFFAVGMILALLSILFDTNFLGHRAAQAYGHLSKLQRTRATLDSHLSEKNEQQLGEQLNEMSERSERTSVTKIQLDDSKDGLPNDFAYSRAALITLNFGAGAWIGGAASLLLALLR